MGDLDGGSAAPATPDVPTLARRLNEPMVERLRRCAADTSPNWDGAITIYPPEARELVALIDAATVTCEICVLYGYTCCSTCHHAGTCWGHRGDRRAQVDHSGVAGEPKATEEESCSCWLCRDAEAREAAATDAPTRGHSPDPVTPSAELTTGCVVVPDEAVEAAATALGESGLLSGSIRAHEDGAVRDVARAVANRVAPLIAAQALRSAADTLRIQIGTGWGIGDAVIYLWRRADELERGGDQ